MHQAFIKIVKRANAQNPDSLTLKYTDCKSYVFDWIVLNRYLEKNTD